MELGLRGGTGSLGLVVNKRTVALRDEEHTLDVVGHALRKVILEFHDARARRQIAHPEGMARLSRGPSWRPWGGACCGDRRGRDF